MNSQNGFAMATVGRLPNVLSANGHVAGVQRAIEAAGTLSRRNVYQAKAALMQEAMRRCLELCYETFADDTTILANVDPDGRILVAVPWSGKRYTAYGLRRGEADALRWEMMNRQDPALVEPPLFEYVPAFRAWFLNVYAYPTAGDALAYIDAQPITWRVLAGYARRPQ